MTPAGLTDEQIAKIRELRAKGVTCYHTAQRMRVPVEVVRALAPPKTGRYAALPYSVDEIRDLRRQGLTFLEIQRRLGVSAEMAGRWCRDIVIPPAMRLRIAKAANEATNAARAAKMRANAERNRVKREASATRKPAVSVRKPGPVKMPERIDVEVPAWVPGGLRDLYVELADRDCEESAASVVRQIKSSGSVACR
jgi:hypothetical protein